ncbi:hypothetical protein B0H10DRAFT_261829 [Mycena sp. CBHHK59/15]|nr:hypothetical protein B0H10DRAFT_261829 [Mycena sp. CBHHK59/15]
MLLPKSLTPQPMRTGQGRILFHRFFASISAIWSRRFALMSLVVPIAILFLCFAG